MENLKKKDLIFYISKGWLQKEAQRIINRQLTESEIDIAKKCIDFGLSTNIDVVFKTAISEAIDINSNY